ncbi:MAG: hypothetical protein ACYC54_05905 [Sedimentisphaerales bacterium]
MSKTMIISTLTRTPICNSDDHLEFQPGVNVVVGPPNTGKTKWLQFIDYLFGDDTKAEEALGSDLYDKYETAIMVVNIGGTEHIIERRWKEAGSKTKVFVDDKPMSTQDAGHFIMEALDIPILHYPQGNPYGPRTWPELSWRSLLRHIYRQQRFWSDFADHQPDSEQHACLLHFLGLAEHLFSDEYGDLVNKEKKINELNISKKQFLQNLQEISNDILEDKSLSAGLTPESIQNAIHQIQLQINDIKTKRQTTLVLLASNSKVKSNDIHAINFEQLSQKIVDLKSQKEKSQLLLQKAHDKLIEMIKYRDLIISEIERLKRAKTATKLLSELKVTHCPACDQEVTSKTSDSSTCYVCGQQTSQPSVNENNQRLKFEVEQLEGELKEAEDLINSLNQEIKQIESKNTQLTENINQISKLLQPIQTVAAQILPPEISFFDMETGRLEERIRQLQRIEKSFNYREILNTKIQQTQNEISQLEIEVAKQHDKLNFGKASDDISDGMKTYLNTIGKINPSSWTITNKPINFNIMKNGFKATIGNESWSAKLGGTLTLYFVIAYHYALMSLTNNSNYHYPGLLLLDFPAELEDGTSIADKENFVLEPFIKLQESLKPTKFQVIAMGNSFKDLPISNRIELKKVWG